MPGIKTKSETLSLRLAVATIVGCYDIHDLMGQPTINKAMSTVVSEALTALVDLMREEGKLPGYTSQEALIDRLRELAGATDPRAFSAPALSSAYESDEEHESSGEDFAELVETLSPGLTRDPIAEGDVDVSNLARADEDQAPPMTFADFETADPKDRLITACKGDPLKERALVEVYSNIPVERRGTELAVNLLASAIEALKVEASDNPEEEKEQS